MRNATELDHVIRVWNRQGWYPVPWRHHPQEIRELIRALKFRPQLKQCYANCQKLMLGNRHLRFNLDLQYREGWYCSVIPVQHAWLLYRGEILDPTIVPLEPARYMDSLGCTIEEILVHMIKTRQYGPVHQDHEIAKIGPYWEALQQLREMRG